VIYSDHAATSFPKPPGVARAMNRHLDLLAVNPGRSGFDLALEAAAEVDRLRADLGRFFGNPAADPDRTVFTLNATSALNLAIGGLCRPGDHVVTTVLEHNSVLRPLHMLARTGLITFDLVPCDAAGFVDPAAVEARMSPQTRLVILNHASNVLGTIQPAAEVGEACRRRGITFLLDAAQTAGVLPVDMAALNVDALAFTGHKGLQGPTGTGGLVLGPGCEPRATVFGGTGVRSAEPAQPDLLPYRLEAGTQNAVGLAGLAAGLAWVIERGQETILAHERRLTRRFVAGCRGLPGVTVHGHQAGTEERHLAVVSVTLEGMDPEKAGMFLDQDAEIAVRTGLQCAPLAHEALGTAPEGTIRFSFGPGNTIEEIDAALAALAALAGRAEADQDRAE